MAINKMSVKMTLIWFLTMTENPLEAEQAAAQTTPAPIPARSNWRLNAVMIMPEYKGNV